MPAIRTIFAAALISAFAFLPASGQDGEDIAIIHSGSESYQFSIEIADTPEATARGLMFREDLAPDAGMLFDFFEERPASFWMQNTLIPLDMLFIKADGEIVRIHENAIPMDRTGIPSGQPVRFVLEIAGGRSAELGLAAGDRLEHPRVEAEEPAGGL
ncbi:MAG TPA: DUF192 domain-containing protein [Pelagibacterium sp.]|uniref:DUF192 domain-containing protein n=1 Tax=Pelagibacterium sp. TaxID=1967288 RepID=UPI002C84D85B|nr:DUF192 domain-containing protein [Pelagibacterium sp.]HWJ87493.1 DUF192 domain-containing protein [Pelagibacterium sp.]